MKEAIYENPYIAPGNNVSKYCKVCGSTDHDFFAPHLCPHYGKKKWQIEIGVMCQRLRDALLTLRPSPDEPATTLHRKTEVEVLTHLWESYPTFRALRTFPTIVPPKVCGFVLLITFVLISLTIT